MQPLFGDAIPTEVVDARRLPFGWEQPGFDDSAWGAAHLIPAGGSGQRRPHASRPPIPTARSTRDRSASWAAICASRLRSRAETLAGQVAATERRSDACGCRRRSTCCSRQRPAIACRWRSTCRRAAARASCSGHGRHRHGAGAVRGARPGRHGARLLVHAKIRSRRRGAVRWDARRHALRGARRERPLQALRCARLPLRLYPGARRDRHGDAEQLRGAGGRLPVAARRRVRVQR